MLCLTIDENRLATGSLDRTVKVWNLFDGSLKLTLNGHYKGVWCLKFITKYLLCSGSFDSTIKIWNLKDATCSRTLFSHFGPVWSLAKYEDTLVSASQDKTVKTFSSHAINNQSLILVPNNSRNRPKSGISAVAV